jgi:pantetheine-phosphate adenylyltransferase
MAKVAVGGTFDPLHDGHLALLKRAFELGKNGTVVIALTSDELAKEHRTRPVKPFEVRLSNLTARIKQVFGDVNFRFEKITDVYGSAIEENFDFIVVSPETEPVALQINEIRRENGLLPLIISLVDYKMAEDLVRISSTRIAEGKIDQHGRLLA